MARPYSMNLRQRAMERLAAGETTSEAAAALKVAVSSASKWTARQRATGSAAPGKMGGHRRPEMAAPGWPARIAAGFLGRSSAARMRRSPRRPAGLEKRGLKLHPVSVGRFLHREGKSFKENGLSRRTGRTDAGPSA